MRKPLRWARTECTWVLETPPCGRGRPGDEARWAVEPPIAALAAARTTAESLQRLAFHATASRAVLEAMATRMGPAHQEHTQVFTAIAAGDAAEAEQAMAAHLDTVQQ